MQAVETRRLSHPNRAIAVHTDRSNVRRIVFLSTAVALISVCYYLTEPRHVYYHTFFRDLYFLPLILSAFWFGLKGAVLTAGIITVVYLPFVVLNWQGFSQLDFSRILEVLLFNAVAFVLGYVSSREKAHQKALRESENLASMGKALSAVAHDMKSPLTAIGGFTRTVYRRLDPENESRDKLATVIKETDRLEMMLKDMLDFSRPLRLELSRGDLNKILQQSLAIVEFQARERDIALETNLSVTLPHIEVDALRIEQVLINLLVNAVQASPQGEKVLIRTYQNGDRICLEIVDRGPGIPDQDRGKIFSPFFTTKREGTGLGLPIALKILTAHKGKIEVLEAGEKGATFRMSLPLRGS